MFLYLALHPPPPWNFSSPSNLGYMGIVTPIPGLTGSVHPNVQSSIKESVLIIATEQMNVVFAVGSYCN